MCVGKKKYEGGKETLRDNEMKLCKKSKKKMFVLKIE